ncbi:MAG: chemotaxis protein CheD [Bacteroidales bacterium]|nr:chemotaxis protein CheD [Bacteroidales bacterium]
MNNCFNNTIQTKNHYLYPSTIFVGIEPTQISTILGSCVAVCLWDKKREIGGMNHFLLPYWNGDGLASPKYGNIAIEKLIDKISSTGSRKKDIVAKVFGGSEMFDTKNFSFNIGLRNIDLARKIITELNIPIVAESVGGKRGRRIIFNTYTGEVRLKLIQSN